MDEVFLKSDVSITLRMLLICSERHRMWPRWCFKRALSVLSGFCWLLPPNAQKSWKNSLASSGWGFGLGWVGKGFSIY